MNLLPNEPPPPLNDNLDSSRSEPPPPLNDNVDSSQSEPRRIEAPNLKEYLSKDPYGADYGRLDNGLTYYVRMNPTPRRRASLALAVKVGSVLEQDDETGVAHIIEHLAFSATNNYSNHEIVAFLQSVGAKFGSCQNAHTTSDSTVYELLVPIDKAGLLSKAIAILAEFSSEIRASAADLDKERGPIMDEYRKTRDVNGRIQSAHWTFNVEGSKYFDRLPIGQEHVINNVTSETVKTFYKKWYHLKNMALIVVGDFSDTQSVLKLIKTHFEDKISAPVSTLIPKFTVPSHKEARFSSVLEKEAGCSSVRVSFKYPAVSMKTVEDFKFSLLRSMFVSSLNQRLRVLCDQIDSPHISCHVATEDIVLPVSALTIISYCKDSMTLEALESLLIEVARVHVHGFSEDEISVARSQQMSRVELLYSKRNQLHSSYLLDEFIKHFIQKENVIGIDSETELYKNLLYHISTLEVSQFSENFQSCSNCCIEVVDVNTAAKIDDLKNLVLKVSSLEGGGKISPWVSDEKPREEFVSVKPNPGLLKELNEHSCIGATEIILTNGMRVCYKCTKFSDDHVSLRGFSYGGLSEVDENEYITCALSMNIADKVGAFGHEPSGDLMADSGAYLGINVKWFSRTFSCECSSKDLETVFQMVYQLFITRLKPKEEDLKIVREQIEEHILSQERSPCAEFNNRVMEIAYGNSPFFKPIERGELKKVDFSKSCEYFDNCYKDPSTFTLIIVGDIDIFTAYPWMLQYLGGIPKPTIPIMHYSQDELRSLPYTFPSAVLREVICKPMVQPNCFVKLCFPYKNEINNMIEEFLMMDLMTSLLETNLLQVLRFKYAKVYDVVVGELSDVNKPSKIDDFYDYFCVKFSCDLEFPEKLIDIALDEISRLQEVGPSESDLATILEIYERKREEESENNDSWVNKIECIYQ